MIFLELVPRDLQQLLQEAKSATSRYSCIDGINIPDVKRLSIRSDEASKALLAENICSLPHIRCMDFTLDQHLKRTENLVAAGLEHLLLISGDPIKNGDTADFIKPPELTRAIKRHFPNLKVYCGLDPYRQSLQAELNYAQEKIEAGADGLFTQPFFDVKLAEIYCEQLAHTAVFLGISPVLSTNSYQYWVTVNNVVFPADFDTSLAHNAAVAKALLKVSKAQGQHSYIMPIKTDIASYLESVFD